MNNTQYSTYELYEFLSKPHPTSKRSEDCPNQTDFDYDAISLAKLILKARHIRNELTTDAPEPLCCKAEVSRFINHKYDKLSAFDLSPPDPED